LRHKRCVLELRIGLDKDDTNKQITNREAAQTANLVRYHEELSRGAQALI